MDNTTKENQRLQLTILFEIFKLFFYLIENKRNESLDRQMHRNRELQNFTRNNKTGTAESQLKRLLHIVLQRTAGADRRAAEFLSRNIHRNLERVLTIQEEFLLNMLARRYDCEINRRCIQEEEAGSFASRLNSVNKIRNLRECNLHDAHYKARKQCLDQLKKYDKTIGTLYAYKTTLLQDRDNLNKDCAIAQNQIFEQLALYDRLKEEQELNAMNVFLAKVEHFRLNHAAKIIQQSWRLYSKRVSSKKKRGRK